MMSKGAEHEGLSNGLAPGKYTTIRQPDGSELIFDNALSTQKLGRRPTTFELNVYEVQTPSL